jgi:hypothetical protein
VRRPHELLHLITAFVNIDVEPVLEHVLKALPALTGQHAVHELSVEYVGQTDSTESEAPLVFPLVMEDFDNALGLQQSRERARSCFWS